MKTKDRIIKIIKKKDWVETYQYDWNEFVDIKKSIKNLIREIEDGK